MIIHMSKVEIAGPRELLLPALETIEQLGVLQLDASATVPAGGDFELPLSTNDWVVQFSAPGIPSTKGTLTSL